MNEVELLKILLEDNFKFSKTIADTSMLWWVSSIVFCISITGACWIYRDTMKDLPRKGLISICSIIGTFFITFIMYPLRLIHETKKLKTQAVEIIEKFPDVGIIPIRYDIIIKCLWIGVATFVLVLSSWILLSIFLINNKQSNS